MKDMGYKAVYLAEEFHKELKKIMVCHKGERIVWLGVHPWLPLIIDFLFDEGCTDFSIVDNDKNKQGNVYFSYRCPNKSFRVEGADALEHIGKSLFIMANTHEIDFAKQLRDVGIQAEIHNLYNYTLKENTFINYGLDVAEKNGFRPITERDLQLKELEVLKEFKRICQNKGLRYWLGAGTMLGAVRHQGFIPWDDDIDVEMPYEDYLKLAEEFHENENYYLLNWRSNDDYTMNFSKLVDKNTFLIHDRWFPNVCYMGCYVDIFPIGGYPSDKEQIERKWIVDDYLDRLWIYYFLTRGDSNIEDPRKRIEKEKFLYPFDDSEMAGGMHRIAQKRWVVPKRVFDELQDMKFEDDYFPVPRDYDVYLHERYGDYTKIPPKEKQRTHSFYTFEINDLNL